MVIATVRPLKCDARALCRAASPSSKDAPNSGDPRVRPCFDTTRDKAHKPLAQRKVSESHAAEANGQTGQPLGQPLRTQDTRPKPAAETALAAVLTGASSARENLGSRLAALARVGIGGGHANAASAKAQSLVKPSVEERLAARTGALHRKQARRLNQGKIEPEARLDLHGLTRDEARARLTAFLLAAQARGLGLVLVITGKGRGGRLESALDIMPEAQGATAGAIRLEFPDWLAAPPLAQIVLDARPAHRRHGGSGAFYLTLRRAR